MTTTESSGLPPRPAPMAVNLHGIAKAMTAYANFVGWRWTPRGDRWDKPPLRLSNLTAFASSNRPETWGTFEDAALALECYFGRGDLGLDGIGFVVPATMMVFDWDGERDPVTGVIHPRVLGQVTRMATVTEVTPSGTGLKQYFHASLEDMRAALGIDPRFDMPRKKTYDEGGLGGKTRGFEVFDHTSPRYTTVTGNLVPNFPGAVEPRQKEALAVYSEMFTARIADLRRMTHDLKKADLAWAETTPDGLQASDEEILAVARAGPYGEDFTTLYTDGAWETVDRGPGRGPYGSQSEADSALCSQLWYYAGPGADPDQVERLFEASALYRPPGRKGGKGRGYVSRSVRKALEYRVKTDAAFFNWSSKRNQERTEEQQQVVEAALDAIYARTKAEQEARAQSTPPPDPEKADAERMKTHSTLRLDALPDEMDFPMEIFPRAVRDQVEAVAGHLCTDVAVPGTQALGVLSFLTTGFSRFQFEDSYLIDGNLTVVVVDETGGGKSPSFRAMVEPIKVIQRQYAREYELAHSHYKDDHQAWSAEKKDTRGPEPEEPFMRSVFFNDVTVESLKVLLKYSPAGLAGLYDELGYLLNAANQYKGGRGNDQAFFLALDNREPLVIDRKSKATKEGRPVREIVDLPYCTIIGNLVTPDLPILGRARTDGRIERMNITIPKRRRGVKRRERPPVSKEVMAAYEHYCLSHYARMETYGPQAAPDDGDFFERKQAERDGQRDRPGGFLMVQMTPDAREFWIDRQDEHDAEVDEFASPDHSRDLDSFWSKIAGHIGRYALILAHAWAEPDESPVVNLHIDRLAWRLGDYFKGQSRRVLRVLANCGLVDAPAATPAFLSWLRTKRPETFTLREVQRNIPNCRNHLLEGDVESAVQWLLRRHGIRKAFAATKGRSVGEPTGTVYEVHPELYKRLDAMLADPSLKLK